jgi:isoleucyl-tRNA synthetase
MPFAQLHYPFENKELFEKNFPADFITEYVGQTRGWFNTLIMLSTALFDKAPFKNCICHGVVLDAETGQKYSKRLKNYKDPKEVMDNFGADALRWMMLASPVMRGADIGVDPEGKFIRDVVRLNIKPLWSAFNFFTLYANADGVKAKQITASDNMLDRYILAKAKAAVQAIEKSLDAYDTTGATEASTQFFDVLNNWYIRRSRPRFWAEEMSADKQAAYDTLFTVLNLLCVATAPLLPFVTEAVYRGLNGASESVHLQDFPDVSAIDSASAHVADMDWVRDVCNAGSAVRNKQNIRNRQPLASLTLAGKNVVHSIELPNGVSGTFSGIICDELNVKEFRTGGSFDDYASVKLQINSAVLGKRLPEKMKQILPASKKGEWKRLADGGVEIAGEVLLAGEYTILLEPKPAYKDSAAPLSSNDALVILDLTITPELEAEGRARDLVRMIQQARKDAGLHVADRITLGLDVPSEFKSALATHGDFIAEQTLATSWKEGSAGSAQQVKQELDGAEFIIGLSKVA